MTLKKKNPIDLPLDAFVDRQGMLRFFDLGYTKGRELELAGLIPPPVNLTPSLQRYSTCELHKAKAALLNTDRLIPTELLPALIAEFKSALSEFTGAPKNWEVERLESALALIKAALLRAQRSQPLNQQLAENQAA